jgi:phage recombination protein Bet
MTEQQVITSAEVTQAKAERKSLIATFADRLGLEPNRMMATLKATAFRGDVSNEQMAALLIVANEHGLNPFTKELYAFPTKGGGIVPVVGVDGWARIVNEHPQFNGMKFEQDDTKCTCIMYRKDREHPTTVTEYMDECRRGTEPWQTHPKRMLRHKAMIQCARLAFAFAGIYDPDEGERILAAEDAIDITPADGRKLVSPVKLRKVVEGLNAAVAAKDGKALWEIINENQMTTDADSARYIWGELRSYESRAVRELMDATTQYRGGLDIGAWSVELLNRSDTADGLIANWRTIQDAYAEADTQVPADIETVYQDRKQVLAVP